MAETFFKLDSLPPELRYRVAEFVKDGRPKYLLSLARVSRRWNKIATRLLYQEVIFLNDWWRHNEANGAVKEFAKFASVVLRKPSLAELVQSVVVHSYQSASNPDVLSSVMHELDKDGFLRSRIWKLFSTEDLQEKWYNVLVENTQMDAILAFTVAHLPNLKALGFMLTLGLFPEWLDELRTVGRWHEAGYAVPFQNLQYVAIEEYYFSYSWTVDRPETLAYFLKFPSLRRLKGHRIGSKAEERSKEFSSIPASSSKVSRMDLGWRTQLHPSDLYYLIRSCIQLEEFYYDAFNDGSQQPHETEFLEETLLLQKHHLKHLSLTGAIYLTSASQGTGIHNGKDYSRARLDDLAPERIRLRNNDWTADCPYRSSLRPINLSELRNLRTLRIDLPYLFDQEHLQFIKPTPLRREEASKPTPADLQSTQDQLLENLPSSLEQISFGMNSEPFSVKRLDYAVLRMLEEKDTKFPRLHLLDFSGEFKRVANGTVQPVIEPFAGDWINYLRDSIAKAIELGIYVPVVERVQGLILVRGEIDHRRWDVMRHEDKRMIRLVHEDL